MITAGGCAVCCVPVQYIRGCAGRVAAISSFSPTHEDLYAAAPFLSPSRRDCGHHGVLEAAVPAAALAFAAAAAAPGSAAAAPTGLSHGVSTGPALQGVGFAGAGRGLWPGRPDHRTRLYERLDASVLFAWPRETPALAGGGGGVGWGSTAFFNATTSNAAASLSSSRSSTTPRSPGSQ